MIFGNVWIQLEIRLYSKNSGKKIKPPGKYGNKPYWKLLQR